MISDPANSETIYAWVYLPVEPVLCGKIVRKRMESGQYKGVFTYGKNYLNRADAIALDLALPLAMKTYETTLLAGHFSVFLDAGPDQWGRREIDRTRGPQTDLGYLLHSAGDQVGALAFTRERNDLPGPKGSFDIESLDDLLLASELLEQGLPVPEKLERLLSIGTSAGGARPKATIVDKDRQWLAKFPSSKDSPGLPGNPRMEAATLDLAALCGLKVPERRLLHVGDKDVLLVERFDRAFLGAGKWGRHRYVSARTVFHSKPDVQQYVLHGSYQRLARELGAWSISAASDRLELFKRIVFNCLVSNTDDHDLNHGLIDTGKGFSLSPLFDVVPRPPTGSRQFLVLSAGQLGSEASRENLLSDCTPFGISVAEATGMVDSLEATVGENWNRCCADRGINEAGRRALAAAFCPTSFDNPFRGQRQDIR